MPGLKGITVNTPPEKEPHIFAEDDAAIYEAIFGEDGVSTIGKRCEATVLSNNKVRVEDGVICVGGHFARIPYGEYVDCEIMNGQSGKKRNDIIVAKFETTGSGGIDEMTCEVKQGEAGTVAVDPLITKENLYEGGHTRELPLYRVKIDGLSITGVEKMFDIVKTKKELQEELDSLNGNIDNVDQKLIAKSMSLLGEPDLNTLVEYGRYFQNANDRATTGKHYPAAGKAGLLETLPGTSSYLLQRYTVILENVVYVRWRSYDGSWLSWAKV